MSWKKLISNIVKWCLISYVMVNVAVLIACIVLFVAWFGLFALMIVLGPK